MKRTIAIVAGILLSYTITVAQTPDPVTTPAPVTQSQWDAKKNLTVDSIAAKYKEKIVAAPSPLSTERVFPVLGTYETTTNPEAPAVSVSLDAANKGIVWIEGLPQGRVKALLARSPSTYKIPAQKTADDKEVAEGTLIYDKEANMLSILIGKKYDAENPSSAFAPALAPEEEVVVKKDKNKTKVKTKKADAPKPWVYTGTKVIVTTAAN